jgi:ParB-like chromosome segregation protein Spo0J
MNEKQKIIEKSIKTDVEIIIENLKQFELHDKVLILNDIRQKLHETSPFKNEPVDFVKWVLSDEVVANDYNPNKVAPPEMELLELSIINDGYTQPIVTWNNLEKGKTEVIDGFHRNRVGKESKIVKQRIKGYLPVVDIRKEQADKNDRIASTIRHNRARGKHQVDAMSEIVIELKNRNWTNQRIAKQLGMDEEEVLRLCQVSGLEHLFSDNDFSKAWESSDSVADYQFEPISDEIELDLFDKYRIPNEDDKDRIYHTFDKWECHKAGFYKSKIDGMTKEQAEKSYADFLANSESFRTGLDGVLNDWIHSCEHYLSNKSMNRIAWLGQAAMCYSTGVPSIYCSGFNLLNEQQQNEANEIALEYLNKWMVKYGRNEISMNEALSVGRQVELY